MKTMTIQQPERYEAPKVKVKELRKRSVICASPSLTNSGIEEMTQDENTDI